MTGATGDFNVMISPEIQSRLEADAIGGTSCHLKRAGSCNVIDFIESVMNDDDKGIQSFLERLKDIQFVAKDLLDGEGAKVFLDALKSTSMYQNGLTSLSGAGAAFYIYGIYSLYWNNHQVPLVVAAKDQPENKTPSITYPGDDQDENGCPKDAPSGDDAPSCDSCEGKDNVCQTVRPIP